MRDVMCGRKNVEYHACGMELMVTLYDFNFMLLK